MFHKKNFSQSLKLSSLLFITFSANVAFSQDYYVATNGNDSNAGTISKPWKTISKANLKLRSGDTVFLRQGTYKENIQPSNSGTASNKIIYTNYPNETAKVVGNPALDYFKNGENTPIVKIRESYIVIKGLTLYHEKLPNCKGYGACWNYQSNVIDITYADAHHNEILNNKIVSPYPLVKLDTELYSKETGIRVSAGANYNLIKGNEIRNMSKIGIVMGNGAKFTKIINNTIKDIYQDCIHYGSGKGIISGTLIDGNTLTGSVRSDGIQANSPIAENRGLIIRNNLIYNNGENNIDLKGTKYIVIEGNTMHGGDGNNDGPTKQNNHTAQGVFDDRFGGVGGIGHGGSTISEDIIIRNNIIFDNHMGIGTKGNSLRWKIYNNTIVNNAHDYEGSNSNYSRGTRNPVFLGVQAHNGNRQQILNNIIGDSPEGEVSAPGAGIHSDYNLYFNTYKATEFAHFKGKHNWDLVDFNQWKNIIKDDKHSLDANPQFVNVPSRPTANHSNLDFSLKSNSPAIDKGSFLTKTISSGSGTQLKVADARFFYNGFGVTTGDTIQLQGQTKTAKVTQVNYDTNTITLSNALTWTSGLGVGLPYKGSSPDIGAKESGGISTTPSDTQAPSIPQNLNASETTQTSIKLNWNASTDNVGVKDYDVSYKEFDSDAIMIKTSTGTSTTLTNLKPGVNYSIKVQAKDVAGNRSIFSAATTVVTDSGTTPTPTTLIANAGSDKLLRCDDAFRTLGNASSNSTSDGATYLWTTSNGQITGANNSKTVKGGKAGTYTLTVSKTGSTTVTDSVIITHETGCTTTPDPISEEPTNPEPVQDKTEEDSAGGSFPIGLLMLGLLVFLRRR